MILTIFGATGQTGKQVVKQALYDGHTVKAFGRNVFTAGLPDDKNLELITGALFDEDQVLKAIKGSDAVISVIGGAFDGSDKSRSLGMKNIVAQMKKAGVDRIIALGGKGVLDDGNGDLIMEAPAYPRQFIPVGTEHFKAYEVLKGSGLRFTFVGAPDLINAEPTGSFHTSSETAPDPDNNRINTGDLALFMLKELKKNEYVGLRVGISN